MRIHVEEENATETPTTRKSPHLHSEGGVVRRTDTPAPAWKCMSDVMIAVGGFFFSPPHSRPIAWFSAGMVRGAELRASLARTRVVVLVSCRLVLLIKDV